jgi:hypothetical protein
MKQAVPAVISRGRTAVVLPPERIQPATARRVKATV